jgi:hypothetical protein
MEKLAATVDRFKQTILKTCAKNDGLLSSKTRLVRYRVVSKFTSYEWWRFYLCYFRDCAADPRWVVTGPTAWFFNTVASARCFNPFSIWDTLILTWLLYWLFDCIQEPPEPVKIENRPRQKKPFIPIPNKTELGGCARSDSLVCSLVF